MLTGTHILGNIYANEVKKLRDLKRTKFYISRTLKKFRLHELGHFYHKFRGGGFTGIVSLVESHIAIHTWPEFKYLTLDVYLCNYSKNNSATGEKVFLEISRYFSPLRVKKTVIKR